MDWAITALAIFGKWLMVRKNKWAWGVSFLNQWLWVVLCLRQELYGLIPLSLFHAGMAIWGFRRWNNDG